MIDAKAVIAQARKEVTEEQTKKAVAALSIADHRAAA